MVYENKYYSNAALASLQYTAKFLFAAHEEGRIRALYNNAGNPNEITGNAYPTLSFEGSSNNTGSD